MANKLVNFTQQLRDYAQLLRLHRPIGIALLLWPTLWTLWIAAKGQPSLKILTVFVLGVIVMRSAGCVINDLADRKVDGFVTRTKERPLVTGRVKPFSAWCLFAGLCVVALLLVLQLNLLALQLAVVGLLLAVIYPFMKRYTHWPQLVLGAAFAWAVPMAFVAVTNSVPKQIWLFFVVALLWPVAYDTLYAMVDRDDDRKIGIKSTAVLLGRYDRLFIGIIQAVVLVLLVVIGYLQQLNEFYFASVALAAGLVVYQQYLIKDRQPQRCFRAFLNNNYFGLVIFLGVVASYYFS